ncbi:basic proline-rich protein-like [Gracilinanus agilis]|uniref:basic proline-rich protein-like n=1 Tax=Gracilinanus agilis TaxID=191870 RepID=UPI001CFD7C45|nr:basic proline-rich protein-like [Gracilinanus agilis]
MPFPDFFLVLAPPHCGCLKACWEAPVGRLCSWKAHSCGSWTFAGCTSGKSPHLRAPPPEGPPCGPSREPAARGNGPRDPEAPLPGSNSPWMGPACFLDLLRPAIHSPFPLSPAPSAGPSASPDEDTDLELLFFTQKSLTS